MADFKVNGKTMSAEQIFNILDASDGKDNVIKKDAWNIFAGKAKGNNIRNFIRKDDAIASIGRYLSNADKTTLSDVFEHISSIEKQSKGTQQSAPAKTEKKPQPKPAQTQAAAEAKPAESKEKTFYQPKMTPAEVQKKYPQEYAMVSEIAKKYNKNADIPYWTELIATASEKYGVEPEAIISIVGREVHLVKNPRSNPQSGGPMQVTQATIADFWPGTWRNKNYWSKVDGKLLNEILYDENGNQRYKTPKDLWKACINDHEVGMKVGILIYKAKEVKAMANMKNCNQFDVISKMDEIKSGMTEQQLNQLQKNTFAAYNGGGTKGYAADAYDSYMKCKKV